MEAVEDLSREKAAGSGERRREGVVDLLGQAGNFEGEPRAPAREDLEQLRHVLDRRRFVERRAEAAARISPEVDAVRARVLEDFGEGARAALDPDRIEEGPLGDGVTEPAQPFGE